MNPDDTMLMKDGKPFIHPLMAMHPANEWTEKAIDEAERSILRILKSDIDFKNMNDDTASWVRYHIIKELYKVADLSTAQLLLLNGPQIDEVAREERESEEQMIYEEGYTEGHNDGYKEGLYLGMIEGRDDVYRRIEKERAENAALPGTTRKYMGG